MIKSLPIEEVQNLIAGRKRSVKINSIWNYNKDYLNGSDALMSRSGGYNKIAMPYILEHENDSEEYKCALSIIKQISEYHKTHIQLEEGKKYKVYGYHTDGATYVIDKIYDDIIYFRTYGLKANISDLRFENIEVVV